MKKQATYGDYVIIINDDSSVSITFQNEECSGIYENRHRCT